MAEKKELLKSLPKIDVLLEREEIKSIEGVPRSIILESLREGIDVYRNNILEERIKEYNTEDIFKYIMSLIQKKSSMHLKRVINATGTVLHTNLGRAVIAESAVNAVLNISRGYNNLEYDLDEGIRGSRYSHVEDIVCKITGAEAALVVNNNAAAVMLVLSTLCNGKEAIVSRGQLVEVGGSFRIPSVMEQSGAKLVEVGATNRTHVYDYENAINDNTGCILKVHQSNYKILGFTEELEVGDFVAIGKKTGIPIIEDIGSGIFIDISKYGLTYEPTVQESIRKGVDIVTFSGDKILGGPQAGIIAGKKEYIEKMKKNQLTRALRIDKMTLAALEATLRLYLDEEVALREIPCLNMLTKSKDILKKDALRLSKSIRSKVKDRAEVKICEDHSQVGGGAMPLESIDTYVVAISPRFKKPQEVEKELRQADIPIVTRLYKDTIIIDVRTLFKDDYKIISETLSNII
ncbi:L-seryl-tRNA(Sec) selenium transferase [Clostridium cylindrosporum]|uniref:L-seryl-tRNA(Sec) selenium transferase n=1 Tax=Clostridium cylindrosporum DSM 605 TaxID=1121307 RepID=A0A0J8DB84_CLOCY|nr:L-seryl-tRNA(Sec) selenium transferase [Clostridium cylindrosporum]KMT21564.1 L-seryl-tRNA(Sec) selenium transferase SelA [Clostridium cylindrosporum DSM 605]